MLKPTQLSSQGGNETQQSLHNTAPNHVTPGAAGFSNAMANALAGGDYRTYGYSCAGAIGFGSKGSWTNAFNQVNAHYVQSLWLQH